MSKQYTYTISFTAYIDAENEDTAEEQLNAMIDRLGYVDTPEGSWDSVEWDLIDEDEETND